MVATMMIRQTLLISFALAATTSNAFVVRKPSLPSPVQFHDQSPVRISTTSVKKEASRSALSASVFDNIFGTKAVKDETPPAPKFDPVVIDPDYRVAGIFLMAGVLLDLIPYIQLTLGPLITALGVLFLVQTSRIRFCFDETAFELKVASDSSPDTEEVYGEGLKDTGENVIVGGANRWECDSIINYDFYPNGDVPILVYFKETQTPESSWNEGPGKLANDPKKIESGEAVPGQVHFFPAVCNCNQLREEFAKRECRKI